MDMILHYNFDDNVLDQAGNNHGSVDGTSSYVSGRIGKAFDFDGNTQILLSNEIPLASGSYSLSFWFNYASSAIDQVFFTDYDYSYNNKGFFIMASSNKFGFWNDGQVDIGNVLDQNVWNHAVLIYNSGTATLYVNGVNVGSVPAADIIFSGIGDNIPGESNYGLIDDLRVYNRALSSSEVTALYNWNGADNFNYHPADNNPQNEIIESGEVGSYVNNYYTGGANMAEALYTVTLYQKGGGYTNTSISGAQCIMQPWNCWVSV
jgi:hypothetical protein